MIKLLRIDDRLIHGQVAMAWTKSVSAEHIIVVDDVAAADKMKKMILSLAKPASTGLDIVSVSEFESIYQKNKGKNLIVICGNPETAFNILDKVEDSIKELNLGGMRYGDGKEIVNEHVSLTPDDKEYLEKIKEKGIEIIMQATPNGKSTKY